MVDRDQQYHEKANRGKYQRLYRYLCALQAREWRTSFSEIESILGFGLPASAHRHRPWWANQRDVDNRSQALAWSGAGWEVAEVDFGTETLLFQRKHPESSSKSTLNEVRSAQHVTVLPQKPRPQDEERNVTHNYQQQTLRLLDVGFIHADVIEPYRGDDGALLELMPQSRYRLAETTPLNRYGKGPFCRFTVKGLPSTTGVYALTVDGTVAYIGRTENLAQRWGPQGFGNISPRNCYVRGQSTNCKVNTYILLSKRQGQRIDLWTYETHEAGSVEATLIREIKPPWNDQRPTR